MSETCWTWAVEWDNGNMHILHGPPTVRDGGEMDGEVGPKTVLLWWECGPS